jgi:hypothetical protein
LNTKSSWKFLNMLFNPYMLQLTNIVHHLCVCPTYNVRGPKLTPLWYKGHVIPSFSHLQGLIWISWTMLTCFFNLGQHLITPFPNFGLCSCYKPQEHVRGVSSYKVCKTQQAWKQSQTMEIFFLPKIRWNWYDFASISSSSQLDFA